MRRSEDRASFHFVGQILFRSPRHVLYIGIFLAIGISAAIIAAMELMSVVHGKNLSMAVRLDEALLLGPRLLAFFLLVGMRVCFAVPVDLDANWLFRLSPKQQIQRPSAGISKIPDWRVNPSSIYVFGAVLFDDLGLAKRVAAPLLRSNVISNSYGIAFYTI